MVPLLTKDMIHGITYCNVNCQRMMRSASRRSQVLIDEGGKHLFYELEGGRQKSVMQEGKCFGFCHAKHTAIADIKGFWFRLEKTFSPAKR
jgi:hypothetical protein